MTFWPLRVAVLALALVCARDPGQQPPGSPDAWDRFRGSAAAIVDGFVYAASRDGALHAIDLGTGEQRWQYATGSTIEESSPAVRDGVVYVGDLDGAVHAVDAKTGKVRWVFKTEGEIRSSPNWSGDRVYIGSYDEHLYGLR